MSKIELYIPHNVPSSKNSKIWTGKHLIWSKTALEYKKKTKIYWSLYASNFRNIFDSELTKIKPVPVEFKFIRGNKHKFDYVNPLQTVLDLMVEYEWIEDDNADIILPVLNLYEYNKENQGVIIKIN